MLSMEETWELQTYGKHCSGHEECEPPLGCLSLIFDERDGLCTDSTCQTDAQCERGQTCQSFRTLDEGPLVRRCVKQGLRAEGEACVHTTDREEKTCAPGLLCNEGWCGRPCQLDEPASCPEGFFCREGLNGPSCLPTCESRACSKGQQCIWVKGGASVCGVLRGKGCLKRACPEGQQCVVGVPLQTEAGLEMWMSCAQPCGEDQPPCARGSVCILGVCRSSCAPERPEVCRPDELCLSYPRGTGAAVCWPR
jgi:hypothetical protein